MLDQCRNVGSCRNIGTAARDASGAGGLATFGCCLLLTRKYPEVLWNYRIRSKRGILLTMR